MNVCIFEDFFISRLQPVNLLRHTSELICGAAALKEKITKAFGLKKPVILHSRKAHEAYLSEKFPESKVNVFAGEDTLFLNSRVLFTAANVKDILNTVKKEKDIAWIQNRQVAAFYTSAESTAKAAEAITHAEREYLVTYSDIEWLELKKIETESFRFINYASDLVLYNEEELINDLKKLVKDRKKRVLISPECSISKHAVLDASEGDIYIGNETVIEPFCYIKGPVYIGEHCTIRSGSALYGPLSVGSNCKLNGEITCSVIHSYVNKAHHGFLGHSYVSEWVNLGAGTTTSNLKNNYSKIEMTVAGEKVNTNSIFLGSVIGDHTKTGINTMLNTGSQIGISANLFGSGYHNKIIPSFSWAEAGTKENVTYDIVKAISTARISMKRRNVEMSPAYDEMLRSVFESREKNNI